MKDHVLRCDCYDPDHQVIFSYDEEDDIFPEMYVYLNCIPPDFWNRLKRVFNYLFRKKPLGFQEVVVKKEAIADLVDYLVEYQNQ